MTSPSQFTSKACVTLLLAAGMLLPLEHVRAQKVPPVQPVSKRPLVAPGQHFTIGIEVGAPRQGVNDFFGMSFTLVYDAAVFAVENAEVGSFLRRDLPKNATILELDQFVAATPGEAPYSVTRVRPHPGISGFGTAAIFKLSVHRDAPEGVSRFALSDFRAIQSDGTELHLEPGSESVEVSRKARRKRGSIRASALQPLDFGEVDVQLEFTQLDSDAEITVTRLPDGPEGGLPEGLAHAGWGSWIIEQEGADAFSADLFFSLESLTGEYDGENLRLLRRSDPDHEWLEIASLLHPNSEDPTHLMSPQVTSFSEFVMVSSARSTAIEPMPEHAAGDLKLTPPYPNPSTAEARLSLSVDRAQSVRVEAFDVLGRRVAIMLDEHLEPGTTRYVMFPAKDLPPGAYLIRATGRATTAVRSFLRTE